MKLNLENNWEGKRGKQKDTYRNIPQKYLCIEPPLHKVREGNEKVVKHCNPEGILQ